MSATLPSFATYLDPASLALQRERVFARSWQYLADAADASSIGDIVPVTLLPGCLDEPLVLTRDDAGLHCLSNVCTHRANVLVRERTTARTFRCGYHGRRFALDGTCTAMPGFPSPPAETDNLPRVPLARLGPMLFAALDAPTPLEAVLAPIRARIDAFDFDRLAHDPSGDRAFEVAAHWALYCENYLEGFHIPFAHGALARTIEVDAYRVEAFDGGVLQTAVARTDEARFELPAAHPEHGRLIAAFYVWLFPNVMLNVYPWGISLNVVVPLSVDRTRVVYRAYVHDPQKRGTGAGGDLDRVEMEDEALVESVQRGVRARMARPGRYAPGHEDGVRHFHELLERACGTP